MNISKITFVKKENAKYPSLIGFAYIHIDSAWAIDGIGVHKNEGKYHLAFPRIGDRSVSYPLDAKTRQLLTDAVQREVEKKTLDIKL